MKQYAVIGAGRFGESVALTLMKLGHEVMVVDGKEEVINKIAPYVTFAASGNVLDPELFESLGFHNIDTAIVAMGSNLEASVISVVSLKELGVEKVVAKALNHTHANVLKKVGADEIVIPEHDMGAKLAHNLSSDKVVDFFNISGDYSVIEIYCPKVWIDKSIKEIGIRVKYGVTLLGILKSDGEFIGNPDSNYIIKEHDKLVLFGNAEEYAKIQKLRSK